MAQVAQRCQPKERSVGTLDNCYPMVSIEEMFEDQVLEECGGRDWGRCRLHHIRYIDAPQHLLHHRLLRTCRCRGVEVPADEGQPEATAELPRHERFDKAGRDKEVGNDPADTGCESGRPARAARDAPHDGAKDPSPIQREGRDEVEDGQDEIELLLVIDVLLPLNASSAYREVRSRRPKAAGSSRRP